MRPMHEAMRLARRRAMFSQSELAEKSGVGQALISTYECGTRIPNVLNAVALARALGISLDEYLGLK